MSNLPSIESIDIGKNSFGCEVIIYEHYGTYKNYCTGGASSFTLEGI